MKISSAVFAFIFFVFFLADLITLSFVSISSSFFFIFFSVILSIVFLLFRFKIRNILFFQLLYVVVIASTIVLYFANISEYGNSYYIGGSDDEDYDEYAAVINNHTKYDPKLINEDISVINAELALMGHNSPLYIYIVSRFYIGVGELSYHTIIPRIFNGFCLVLSGFFIYLLIGLLGLDVNKYGFLPPFLYVLNPLNLFITGHVFRDSLVALIVILAIWLFYRLNNRFQIIIAFLICFFLFSGLRFLYLIPLIVLYAPRLVGRLNFFFSFTLISLISVYFMDNIESIYYLILEYSLDLNDNRGNGYGLSSFIFQSSYPLQFILRVLYSLITPYFLTPVNVQTLFLFVGTFLNILMIPLAILGFMHIKLVYNKSHIIIFVLFFYFSYTFGTFMFRHIPTYLWFICIFASVGFFCMNRHNSKFYFMYLFLVFSFFVIINILLI